RRRPLQRHVGRISSGLLASGCEATSFGVEKRGNPKRYEQRACLRFMARSAAAKSPPLRRSSGCGASCGHTTVERGIVKKLDARPARVEKIVGVPRESAAAESVKNPDEERCPRRSSED